MMKLKTNSAAKKRFRKLGSGLIKRGKGFRRHHSWAKSSKQVRQLRAGVLVHENDHKSIARLLPN
ncbi:50S ribosomal protein L35 [Candidatus Dependentiae bacterium]|nr:50S ribosomal protein L35 [Candidatus Dependentiae bacterium]